MWRFRLFGGALAPFLLLFHGCGGTSATSKDEIAGHQPGVATIYDSGQTFEAGKSMAPAEYRIGMLDELEIRVKYHERFNDRIAVRPDGRITLVDVGDQYVAGMTPTQVTRLITKAFAGLVHDPLVTVFVRSFSDLNVYVFGEVGEPGIFDFKPNMSVLQAIAVAGGPIRGAKLKTVALLRRNDEGKLEAIVLDLNRKSIKLGAVNDIFLQPRDIIFVPKTFIASSVDFLDQIYDGILPPVDTYIRAIRAFDNIR